LGGVVIGGGGDPPPPPSSGGGSSSPKSSSNGSSGGSSNGSSGGNFKQSYIQEYRLIFDANVKVNMKLVDEAAKNNWSLRYFRMQVRLRDPRYFKSAEAKERTLLFTQYWKAVFPGAKVTRGLLRDYLRSSWSELKLQQEMTKLPAFRKQYAYYGQFATAQRREGLAKNVNPLAYKQYQQTFRNAYRQLGMEPPAGYERLFFRSGMSDEDFLNNLQTMSRGSVAATWDVGGINEQQQQAGLFNQQGAGRVRDLLRIALNKQSRFMQAPGGAFRLGEDNGLVTVKGL
jgi:hypothetical protein